MTVRPFGLLAVHVQMRTSQSRVRSRKMPSQNPATAGMKANFPNGADSSLAGIRRLQIEAAIMTPDAKPVSPLWTWRSNSCFMA